MICSLVRVSSGAWMRKRPVAFHPGPGGQVGQSFEGPEELGTAVGITRIIDAVDPDEDIEGAQRLGPGQGQREEDRVPAGT